MRWIELGGAAMITYATLVNRKVVVPSATGKYFAVDEHYFKACHRADVGRVQFDEDWYLARYPDIADALASGTISSAHEHYATRGYYEHRMPYEIVVDEDWYLQAYPDVSEAVTKEVFMSGQEHFDALGFREGRLPFAHFSLRTMAL